MKSELDGLRPAAYQLTALTKILMSNLGGMLISDGVGVGKTISAGYIAVYTLARLRANTVIICPPGLVEKWRFEFRTKFATVAYSIRNGEELDTAKSEQAHAPNPRVYVLPYSQIVPELGFPVGTVIVDEIHNFRNPATQGWNRLAGFVAGANLRVGLSATPVSNSSADLAAILALLLPAYGSLVLDAIVSDVWAGREFGRLSPVMTRFTRENLKHSFTAREIHDVVVEFPGDYASRVRELVEERTGRGNSSKQYPIEAITFYREAASSPRAFSKSIGVRVEPEADTKVANLVEVLSTCPGHVIVFCQFTETVRHLSGTLTDRPVFELTGDVPPLDRESIISAFRRAGKAVLLMTVVGSEGLDLQFCDTIVNYDLHWNPMVLEQRIGRVDRIGQKKPVVRVFNFHVVGSIDDHVISVLSRKLKAIAWTPLSVTPIAHSGDHLYSDRAVESETRVADQLVESLRLSGSILLDDGPLVDVIDLAACDPRQLRGLEPLAWVKVPDRAPDRWFEEFGKRTNSLRGLLERYRELSAGGSRTSSIP
jgi:SNF2 family DNA or RNA helicase